MKLFSYRFVTVLINCIKIMLNIGLWGARIIHSVYRQAAGYTARNRFLNPDRGKSSLRDSVKTGCGVYPASYPMLTEGSFHGGGVKAAGT
jgi:hypothetical protein